MRWGLAFSAAFACLHLAALQHPGPIAGPSQFPAMLCHDMMADVYVPAAN